MRASVRAAAVALLVALGALVVPLLGGFVAPARAAPTYPPLDASLTGPTTVGTLLSANYTLNASGGPAVAANGTVVGSYKYSLTFTALNRTGIVLGPASQGVILNGSTVIHLSVGNTSEPVTIAALVTSTYQGVNVSKNVTLLLSIVQPYVLTANLVVGSGASVNRFPLVVDLDGAPVGTVSVPTLTAGSSYPISFRYVNTNLAPGWHTFTVSLAAEHGLVTFTGGSQSFSASFYVAGSPPDNTLWYVTGAVAFVGAIFIWTARVGARRRGKAKK